jgi:alkanesulfonate monooxygenase SsuD/methylene tetrahydromethanopterin reductase-like flavin-dependent oxidoreductase (luciferase family)
VQHALFLPLFDGLADPRVVAGIAADAEAAGWDGLFVWDHLRYRAPVTAVADAWITLAAVATATERLRFGPMVTPLPRRRPVKVARETASLDVLSQGRLTLGVGIAGDRSGELSRTGEELSDRVRGAMLDEALDILTAAWTGAAVVHRGEHYTVDDVVFLPRPVQHPLPIWVAARYGNARPLRRAVRFQGVFPVDVVESAQLAEVVAGARELRGDLEGFDVVVERPPGTDPRPYAEAGATWWLESFPWDAVDVDQVRGVVRAGPRR